MIILPEKQEEKNTPERIFSLFGTHYEMVPTEQITLDEFVSAVRNGRWKTQVFAVRKALQQFGRDSDEHKAAKAKLPAITLSASCSSRSADKSVAEKLLDYTHIIQADFDLHAPEEVVREFKEQLSRDPHILFAAISPSGDGIKAALAYKTPDKLEDQVSFDNLGEIHKAVHLEVDDYLWACYEKHNDPAVKDIFRICYILDDPEIYYNPEAVPLELGMTRFKPRASEEKQSENLPTTASEANNNLTEKSGNKLERIVQGALEKVRSAPQKTRQNITLQQAVHLGTYIGSGYLDEADIKQRLLDAVKANLSYKPADEKERITAIDNGISYGKQNPKVLQTEADLQEKLVAEYEFNGRKYKHETTLEEIITIFNTLDDGEADLLKRLFYDKIRHILEKRENGWVAYNGGAWRETHTEVGRTMARAIRDVLEPHYEAVRDEINDNYAEIAHERKKQRLKNTGWENAKRNYLEVVNDEIKTYNSNHYLLNCLNGTYDLGRNIFREHRAEDLITRQLAVDYDATAECSEWEKFLDRVYLGNQEIIRFIQSYIGLCLSGEIVENFLFFYGTGKNGKSTLLGVLLELFGEYGEVLGSEVFTGETTNADRERIRLLHKRFAVSMEINDRAVYNSQVLKSLSSQDPIKGEAKYENAITFLPTHKLVIMGNHKPKITDTSEGLSRRLILVPHLWRISEEEELPTEVVRETFRKELSGILRWAIKGWELFCRQRHKLIIPEILREATTEYFSDHTILPPVLQFLNDDEKIRHDKHNLEMRIRSSDLYEVYKRWADDHRYKQMTQTAFSTELKNQGYKKTKTDKGHYFLGIGLVPKVPERDEEDYFRKSPKNPIEAKSPEPNSRNGGGSQDASSDESPWTRIKQEMRFNDRDFSTE